MERGRSLTKAGQSKRRLLTVFGITAVYLVAEVVGGVLTGSLALLADAGHMFTDVAGLGLALFAIRFAARPATPARTYGYYRVEILAALTNAVVLIGISLYILYEAYQRFQDPPPVASESMLAIATLGLVVNGIGLALLRHASGESLNIKGAYFEVLSDTLSSVGVILAALIMWTTGWLYADPLISAFIGLFILPRTWFLMRESVGILLEGTPSDVNLTAIRDVIRSIPGVRDLHDLHVWTLTSGFNALSVHVVVERSLANHTTVLTAIHYRLSLEEFNVSHVTAQLEPEGWETKETHL